jgi:hypothetical protein
LTPVGFEPTVSVCELPQAYAFELTVTGTGASVRVGEENWGLFFHHRHNANLLNKLVWLTDWLTDWLTGCLTGCLTGLLTNSMKHDPSRKGKFSHLVKEYFKFYETESLFSCSQEPAVCPNPKPHKSSKSRPKRLPSVLFKLYPLTSGSSKRFLYFRDLHQYPAHAMVVWLF